MIWEIKNKQYLFCSVAYLCGISVIPSRLLFGCGVLMHTLISSSVYVLFCGRLNEIEFRLICGGFMHHAIDLSDWWTYQGKTSGEFYVAVGGQRPLGVCVFNYLAFVSLFVMGTASPFRATDIYTVSFHGNVLFYATTALTVVSQVIHVGGYVWFCVPDIPETSLASI